MRLNFLDIIFLQRGESSKPYDATTGVPSFMSWIVVGVLVVIVLLVWKEIDKSKNKTK
jgi:hypothetical protein